jgi:hypothetical protein
VTGRAAAAVALALAAADADAADLRVSAPPARPPASLTMRDAPASPPAAPTPRPARRAPEPAPGARAATVDRFAILPTDLDTLAERVIFHFQLGQVIAEGQKSPGYATASGQPLDAGTYTNANDRFFAVGDLSVGTRGMLIPSLGSYLAARFVLDQEGGLAAERTTSVPSLVDVAGGRAVLVRSAYAELDDLGGRLAPLRVRAGRHWRYGLAALQLDGLSAWWERPGYSASVFLGRRVSMVAQEILPSLPDDAPPLATGLVSGFSADVRLLRVGEAPLLFGGEVWSFDGQRFSQGTLRLQLTPAIDVSTFARWQEDGLARWGARLDARLGRTTLVVVDAEHRLRDDWIYDFVVRRSDVDFARYLHLGPQVPELRASARAGTVLLANLDVLLSLAVATPLATRNPWSTPWFEVGAAVDGRLTSPLSLGVTLRVREHLRADLQVPLAPDLFADQAASGERTVYEGGSRVRYALGRRRFAAEAEVFLRYSTSAHVGLAPGAGSGGPYALVRASDLFGGARLRLETWLGPRLRLAGEYEVISVPDEAKELVGIQRLHVLGEVSF